MGQAWRVGWVGSRPKDVRQFDVGHKGFVRVVCSIGRRTLLFVMRCYGELIRRVTLNDKFTARSPSQLCALMESRYGEWVARAEWNIKQRTEK